jgi:hypothetical protein
VDLNVEEALVRRLLYIVSLVTSSGSGGGGGGAAVQGSLGAAAPGTVSAVMSIGAEVGGGGAGGAGGMLRHLATSAGAATLLALGGGGGGGGGSGSRSGSGMTESLASAMGIRNTDKFRQRLSSVTRSVRETIARDLKRVAALNQVHVIGGLKSAASSLSTALRLGGSASASASAGASARGRRKGLVSARMAASMALGGSSGGGGGGGVGVGGEEEEGVPSLTCDGSADTAALASAMTQWWGAAHLQARDLPPPSTRQALFLKHLVLNAISANVSLSAFTSTASPACTPATPSGATCTRCNLGCTPAGAADGAAAFL